MVIPLISGFRALTSILIIVEIATSPFSMYRSGCHIGDGQWEVLWWIVNPIVFDLIAVWHQLDLQFQIKHHMSHHSQLMCWAGDDVFLACLYI